MVITCNVSCYDQSEKQSHNKKHSAKNNILGFTTDFYEGLHPRPN